MRGRFNIAAIAVLMCSGSLAEDASQPLSVEFDTAQVSLAPRTSDEPIQLPDLIFAVRAQAHCPATTVPTSMSVSIADSRITIAPDADNAIEQKIHVSGKQLGPVVATGFCLEGATDSLQQLDLEGALSAHISLRCKGQDGETIKYAATSLNVALRCEKPEEEQQ